MIRIGPAGIGGKKEAISNLEYYKKNNITATEVAFTYGIYLKENNAIKIGNKAKQLDIKLSVHAPYWINLNSKEKIKIKASKERILKAAKTAEKLQATPVVFHPGYYGKFTKEQTYENIKNQIINLKKQTKIKLAPETMGKVNVFGNSQEILNLVKDTNCSFCLDFAHLFARNQGKTTYKEILKPFKKFKHIHAHFSGIEYSAKGERRHKPTPEKEIEKLMKVIKKSKINFTIINESPNDVNDAIKMIKYL